MQIEGSRVIPWLNGRFVSSSDRGEDALLNLNFGRPPGRCAACGEPLLSDPGVMLGDGHTYHFHCAPERARQEA
jgi:hypothetical protein